MCLLSARVVFSPMLCLSASKTFLFSIVAPAFVNNAKTNSGFLDSSSARLLFLLFSWLTLPPWACRVLGLSLPLGLPCLVVPFACASAFSCVFVCAFVCAYASLCCCSALEVNKCLDIVFQFVYAIV